MDAALTALLESPAVKRSPVACRDWLAAILSRGERSGGIIQIADKSHDDQTDEKPSRPRNGQWPGQLVYFILLPNGNIKIGTTTKLSARLRTLKYRYGERIEVLLTMDGGWDLEKQLHERFAHLRLRRTEQFRPEAELLRFMYRKLE